MAGDARSTAPSRIVAVRFLASAEIPRGLARDVVMRASRRLAVPCGFDPVPWDNAPVRLDGREQVDADALLLELEAGAVPGTVRVGLTGLDLGIAIFTFVFGRARRGGSAAVVSLARLAPERYGLAPDRDLYLSRVVAEVIHELGHVAGLDHCEDYGCIMRFAPTVEMIDLRGKDLCATCAAALPVPLVIPPGAR